MTRSFMNCFILWVVNHIIYNLALFELIDINQIFPIWRLVRSSLQPCLLLYLNDFVFLDQSFDCQAHICFINKHIRSNYLFIEFWIHDWSKIWCLSSCVKLRIDHITLIIFVISLGIFSLLKIQLVYNILIIIKLTNLILLRMHNYVLII